MASGLVTARTIATRPKLAAALHCQRAVTKSKAEPVPLVTGTGVDGSRAWPLLTQPALTAARHPSCFLDFPQHTTGDMQVAAEYVTYGIRTVALPCAAALWRTGGPHPTSALRGASNVLVQAVCPWRAIDHASDLPEQAIRDRIVALTLEAATNILAAPVIAREPTARLRRC